MPTAAENDSVKRAIRDFLACFIIILSHFANYIVHTGYGRFYPDILAIAGVVFLISGLLTAALQLPFRPLRVVIFASLVTVVIGDALFEFGVADISARLIALSVTLLVALTVVFFLKEHTSTVLIGASLAMLFSTLVISASKPGDGERPAVAETDAQRSRSPVVVHLVLDEHIGLAGMSADLPGGTEARKLVREFFVRNGFRIYSRAYSQFYGTGPSLATALNFDISGGYEPYLTTRQYGFSLDENRYFQHFADKDLDIVVFQSDYFDFCSADDSPILRCETYKPDSVSETAIASLSLSDRVGLLLNMYYSSIAIVKLAKLGETALRRWATHQGITLPSIGLWHGRIGPIAVAPVLDEMALDLQRTSGGTLFFAHLLLPHYPYVYQPSCDLRTPLSSWKLRQRDDGTNTAASRAERYGDYFDQVQCTLWRLATLFEVMKHSGTFENAIIVVHGDHGSRITVREPNASASSTLTVDDYLDSFSTFVALKAPGVTPGVDQQMLSLPEFLSFIVSDEERPLSRQPQPTVYLPHDTIGLTAQPLPDLPTLAD